MQLLSRGVLSVNHQAAHLLAPLLSSLIEASTCKFSLLKSGVRFVVNYLLSDGTVDFQGRQHDVDFILSPYYGADNLSFSDAQKTLALNYRRTRLYTERLGKKTSGLDALGVRPAEFGFPLISISNPPLPIPSRSIDRLTLDSEGLVLNADGT